MASTTMSGPLTVTNGVVADITGDVAGNVTGNIEATATAAVEYGAGVIGTGATPTTTRREENGTIITEITVDVTGLASVATANDVIGLAAGGVAYLGQYTAARYGIVYRTEFICLETPVGGDDDINVVTNVSAILEYDGAGGTTYISNSGDLLAGQSVENKLPAITDAHYFYLTAGTGDTAAAYTAGQYLLRTYGHALLT